MIDKNRNAFFGVTAFVKAALLGVLPVLAHAGAGAGID